MYIPTIFQRLISTHSSFHYSQRLDYHSLDIEVGSQPTFHCLPVATGAGELTAFFPKLGPDYFLRLGVRNTVRIFDTHWWVALQEVFVLTVRLGLNTI